jgi:hypothetical protein
MKFGKSSQSIIPVPDLYYTRTLRPVETFNISKHKKRYFRPNDLFYKTQDINLGNNLRNINRRYEQYNQTKLSNNYKSVKLTQPIYTHDDGSEREMEHTAFKRFNYRSQLRDKIKSNINSLVTSLERRFNYEVTKTYIGADRFNNQLVYVSNETQNYENTLKRKIEKITGINEYSGQLMKNSTTSLFPYLTQKSRLEETVSSSGKFHNELNKSKSKCFNTMKNNEYFLQKPNPVCVMSKKKLSASVAKSMFYEP